MKVALNGCGQVGRALIRYWFDSNQLPEIVLIRRSSSQWFEPSGISREDLGRFLDSEDFPGESVTSMEEILSKTPIDIWFELTPTDFTRASEVHSQLVKILDQGISVILANKAPVVHDYVGIKTVADERGAWLGLSCVLGASLPAYALGHYGAMGATIEEVAGILNSTTNVVLSLMEQGYDFNEAIEEAIKTGLAESEWSQDINGFDSGVKMAILASVLFNKNVSFNSSGIQGIRDIRREDVERLKSEGKRYKLIARYQDEEVRVAPEVFTSDDWFYHITGSQKLLWLKTKELADMSVFNGETGLPEVAASLQRDLLWIDQEKAFSK